MGSNLTILANGVHDERTFLEFLYMLMKDRESEANKERTDMSSYYTQEERLEWQNSTIEDYLKSTIKWAEVTENDPKHYSIPPNPWRRIAQILHAGKNN